MAEHTPLPWHRSKHSNYIRRADGDWPAWNICEMNQNNPNKVNDAAYIDRAVNCHDDLLAALEALVDWMDASNLTASPSGGVGVLTYEGVEYSVVSEARAAIKRAV